MISETNLVKNPMFSGSESNPTDWEFKSPRPDIAAMGSVVDSGEDRMLRIGGIGDPHAFSWWQGKCDIIPHKWYRCSVMCRISNIENPELSLFAQAAGHYLTFMGRVGEVFEMGCEFKHHRPEDGSAIELYLRSSSDGAVDWFEPCLVEIPEPVNRMVRVATTRFGNSPHALTMEEQRGRIANILDEAAAVKPDIVCLTEFCAIAGVDQSEYTSYWDASEVIMDGPTCKLISQKAVTHNMYVIAGLIERRGKHMFNTAVVFGRDGKLVGTYEKTHPTFGEMQAGVSCGSNYPVFDLDFGRIAIQICYDEWFPEVTRLQAHQGAEIVFLPVVGGKPIIWRTRAMDSNVYFVSASVTPQSMIIDSSGVVMAETHDSGFVYADLDLDVRKVNWYLDPTLTDGMPGIEPRMRNAADHQCLDELARLIRNIE